jgi:CTP synthase (UTP-ammonia lyase)
VDRQERDAEARDILHALGDRVLDVVQLHVEEHALAGADQRIGERKSAREGELIADLVERDAVTEPFHHRLGVARRVQVERDNQAIAGTERHGHLRDVSGYG